MKLKGPKYSNDYDRWRKILLAWIRLQEKAITDSEVVSAVILGLNESPKLKNGELVVDVVLDLEEAILYPTEDVSDDARVFTLKDGSRAIPGLQAIMNAMKDRFSPAEDVRLFAAYSEFESMEKNKDETMKDFINRFERMNKKLKRDNLEIPELLLGYRLMKSAKLGNNEVIARVGASKGNLTLQTMKDVLMSMDNNVALLESKSSKHVIPKIKLIKEEPAEVLHQFVHCSQSDSSLNGSDTDQSDEDRSDNLVFYQMKPSKQKKYQKFYKRRHEARNDRGNNKKLNVKDQQGQVSRCKICESVMHWARNCPHKENEPSTSSATVILKVNSNMLDEDQLTSLSPEAKNIALIDCGAAKTVVGKQWFDIYESSLGEDEKRNIKEVTSFGSFKFGDGRIANSTVAKVIPVEVCGQKMLIKADLIDNDVPLLISNQSLKAARAKINFVQDTMEIDGKIQKLITTGTGHYGIAVGRHEDELLNNEDETKEYVNRIMLQKDCKDSKMIAEHLHRYFGHASPKAITQLVKKSKHELKEEIIRELNEMECNLCKKYKRETPKPKTALPMANRFNQTVAMDLKFLEGGTIILHCIDMLTRFSLAKIICNKTKETIVEGFMDTWVAVFGFPEETHSDNGKEFCNQAFLDMCQNLNIRMNTTAGYSPFSNGIVERHNGILANMLGKIKDDVGCTTKVALCWAVQAKNSMSNVHGFSPMQLVLGFNPRIPGLTDGEINLGQIEGQTSSEIVANNLNAMHEARKAFLEAQSSDRLKRALKGRVYQSSDTHYFSGDEVYYRTKDTTWRGPGVVIGQYKKLVLVKHGGTFVRVHPTKIVLKTEADKRVNEVKIIETPHDANITSATEADDKSDSDSDEDSDVEERTSNKQQSSVSQEAKQGETPQSNWIPVTEDAKRKRFVLKAGDKIRYQTEHTSEIEYAEVVGPSGTANGVNKNRYNINNNDGQSISIHADRMVSIEKAENFPTNVLLTTREKIKQAKDSEIQNFENFGVFREIDKEEVPENATVVSTRWITQEKEDGRIKARIVARGFQDRGFGQNDAPTVEKLSTRIFMSLSVMRSWKVYSIDVKSAFLQSTDMQRDVYLVPPKDVKNKGEIWKATKPVYGLKDAARNWFDTLRTSLIALDCKQSIYDPSFFMNYEEGMLAGMFISHVDDFLFAGSENFMQNVIGGIKAEFIISSEQEGNFKYVGLYINQDNGVITLSQEHFGEKIQPIKLAAATLKDKERFLDPEEKTLYQALLGKINWLCHQTRPDLAFDCYIASLSAQKPTIGNLKMLNKVAGKVKEGLRHIMFSRLDEDELLIIGFCDASLANLPDKVSSGEGYMIFLADRTGKCCPLNWKSKKVNRVVHSTIAAEGLSLIDCYGEAMYGRKLVQEIMKNTSGKNLPIKIFTDSIQLRKALYSTNLVTEKPLRLTIAEMKQVLEDPVQNTEIHWVKSANMISDCLTKLGASVLKMNEVLETGSINLRELLEDESEKMTK